MTARGRGTGNACATSAPALSGLSGDRHDAPVSCCIALADALAGSTRYGSAPAGVKPCATGPPWGNGPERGAFLSLIEGGHTPATEVAHPATPRAQWRMTASDIVAFHARFTTPTLLVTETGHHRNTILAALNSGNVQAFQPEGRSVGPIDLRGEAAPALAYPNA